VTCQFIYTHLEYVYFAIKLSGIVANLPAEQGKVHPTKNSLM
jgi:hypothetical protein